MVMQKKELASEKYGGRTIYYTSEKTLLQGKYWSVPTIRAYIIVTGKKKEVGQGMRKEIAKTRAHRRVKEINRR